MKLDECLKKVQQENEDLKARMDRHAALSRFGSSFTCLLVSMTLWFDFSSFCIIYFVFQCQLYLY